MPVIDVDIQEQILSLMNDMNNPDPNQAKKNFADGLGKIIADAIRSGTVTISNIAVTGTAGAVPVVGTATGTATIS